MKKAFFIALVMTGSFTASAQKSNDNLKFNAGAELILPVSSGYKTSVGFSGQVPFIWI